MTDSAVRVATGRRAEHIWVEYRLAGDWVVRIDGAVSSSADGPLAVSVSQAADQEVPSAVTAEVLRAVPLNDARKVLRRLRSDALAARDHHFYELPARMVTPKDWIKFARAYARSATRNPHQPTAHLARATGLSPNTISARIRRAQELGLLVATAETDAGAPWLVLAGDAEYTILGKA